ncbi:peptidylprolyl isomerase [Variovorax fucosicus]|uniref:peptidylprolyl isomerase n=1 Tax=Variovorax fucosicus TaxID=3053517 RepID=UPI0025749541|nr:peptidylprolyl isomerase [Variovorax sp. J22G47]MDM0055060.1 peptidylprolyl isomerase [Variovorax sp. J22G47]
MKHLRSTLTLAVVAALAAAFGAQAQGSRPNTASTASRGITDIMRAPQRFGAVPPAPRAPAAPTTQRAAEYIVALVNSEPITNSDVQQRVARIIEQNPAEAGKIPRPELNSMVLERLIGERAQLQVAKEQNIKVDDVAVDQAEQTVARQNQLTVEELRKRVAAEGLTQVEFRRDLRNQLLLTRLREREVEPRVKISDLEVEQFLRDQRTSPNAALAPDINIAQIMVAVPEGASDAQVATLQQKAQGIAQRARSGEDFAKLATELSDSPDKANGGALGLRNAERYPPLFVEATASTPVNGVAGPVRSGAGFHVLKVLAKVQAGASDATVTQTQVRHILLRTDARLSNEQAVAKLAEFKRRIQGGTADFAGLARDNSQDASAKDGGELGWSRSGQFVPEFEDAMNRLAPGQISDPVVSRFGVHLIQVEGRRESKLTPAEQREAARNALREKRLDEAFDTWSQEVRARAFVEFREPPQS